MERHAIKELDRQQVKFKMESDFDNGRPWFKITLLESELPHPLLDIAETICDKLDKLGIYATATAQVGGEHPWVRFEYQRLREMKK